jgi:hypothetical protein
MNKDGTHHSRMSWIFAHTLGLCLVVFGVYIVFILGVAYIRWSRITAGAGGNPSGRIFLEPASSPWSKRVGVAGRL